MQGNRLAMMIFFFLLKTDSKLCDICVSITTIKKYKYIYTKKTIHCYVEKTRVRGRCNSQIIELKSSFTHRHHKQDNDDARGGSVITREILKSETEPSPLTKKEIPYGSLNYLSKTSEFSSHGGRGRRKKVTRKNLLFYKTRLN